MTGDSPKQKVRHSSSLQGNSEWVLALTWPKQLSCNPNQGASAATNTPQMENSNPWPTAYTILPGNGWAIYTVPNKEKPTPSVDKGNLNQRIGNTQWAGKNLSTTASKTWGKQQPQNRDSEHGSHMGNQPQRSVHEGKACTQQQNTWEKHTQFLREDSCLCVRGNNLTSARESTGHREDEQTFA